MKNVEACFKISFTEDQLLQAKEYVEDMKKHPKRIYWLGKKEKSDEELIYGHIAHRILSGYYNSYDPLAAARQILDMKSKVKE
ncbi:MAG: hypothetical protein ACNS60_07550 [Candidatus Cyclobacteriaceae bacterium M2_1C_046]